MHFLITIAFRSLLSKRPFISRVLQLETIKHMSSSGKVNLCITPNLRLRSDFECGSILFEGLHQPTDTALSPSSVVPSLRLCLASDVPSRDRTPSDSEEGESAEDIASRMWFYFRIEWVHGPEESSSVCPPDIDITLRCISAKSKLYPQGYRPFFRRSTHPGHWDPIPDDVTFEPGPGGSGPFTATASFRVPYSAEWMECAFCVPYTLSDVSHALDTWATQSAAAGLMFTRKTLAYSLLGLPMEVATIWDPSATPTAGALLFSARVHPAEVPSSWMMHGLVDSLLSGPNRAILQDFVIHVVPVLNPDGVHNGYTRGDTEGRNLNRYYDTATKQEHPTIYALRELFVKLHRETPGGLYMYVDLHAHATRRGAFLYGNKLGRPEDIAHTLTFVDQMAVRCPQFDRSGCNFTEKNMQSKGRNDSRTKQGCSRVALYALTGHTRTFTFEVNYAGSRAGKENNRKPPEKYSVSTFQSIGRCIVESCHGTWLVMMIQSSSASSSQTANATVPPTAMMMPKRNVRRTSVNKAFFESDTTNNATKKELERVIVI